jgi:RNA polymerase sigma factor (TIGR02999 family)
MNDVTQILSQTKSGDPSDSEELLPQVYNELRKLAAARLARETPGQTLQATALVHEAYLRLVCNGSPHQWDSRGHFFAAAAEAMRQILIEHARRKAAVRHGGEFRRLDFVCDELAGDDCQSADLLALDECLTELERHDQQAAQVVKLRYFAGLTLQETAEALEISRRTVDRSWALAKAWLYRRMTIK